MPPNWSNGKNGRKHSLTPGKCRYLSGEQEMWRNLFQKKARAVVGSKLNQKNWKKKVGVKFCKRIFPSVVVDVNYRPALVPLSWKCKKLSQIRKVFQQTSSWKVIQQTVMKMWKISRQGISKQQSGHQWINTRNKIRCEILHLRAAGENVKLGGSENRFVEKQRKWKSENVSWSSKIGDFENKAARNRKQKLN